MMNLNNLKNEYFAWIDKFDVIADRLESNKNNAPERKDLFLLIEDPDYYQFMMVDYYEDAIEVNPELKNLDMDKLREEHAKYVEETRKAIQERLEIYNDHLELNQAFDAWARRNNLDWRGLHELQKERNVKTIEWDDWDSNQYIYSVMKNSIDMTDEEEVNKIISDARKVLNSVGYTDEKDYWETHDYLNYLELINKNVRHDIDDNCWSTLAIDVLENRALWLPDREHFKMGILKVLEMVDETFLKWDDEE